MSISSCAAVEARVLAEVDTGRCPFCWHHPYETVDVMVGLMRVAINCCGPMIAMYYAEGSERRQRFKAAYKLIRQSNDPRRRRRQFRKYQRALTHQNGGQ